MFVPPKRGDKVFCDQGGGIINLDWVRFMQNYGLYADAFIDGGHRMIDQLLGQGSEQIHSDLFLPICYLYRHAIELRLKHVLLEAEAIRWVEVDHEDLSKEHKLHQLWNKARPILLRLGAEYTEPVVNALGAMIAEVHKIDPESQQFRYPLEKVKKTGGKNGIPLQLKPSLEKLPQEFSLQNLKEKMDKIDTVLSGAVAYLNVIWDMEAEQAREWC